MSEVTDERKPARAVTEPILDGTASAQYSAAALAHDAEVFGDVSIVELARTMEALEQRLEVIERWRTAFIDQENGGGSERKRPKWARKLRSQVDVLFVAVADLTSRMYEVEDNVYEMRQGRDGLIAMDGQGAHLSNRGVEDAPKRKLPRWARRLKKMGGTLQFSDLGTWTVVVPPARGDEVEAYFDGVTPQAAIAAAWREWKEERE